MENSEEKIKFWHTPDGKIVSHGIHEHNSGSSSLGINIKLLKIYLEKQAPDLLIQEDIQKAFQGISNAKDRMKESMDYVYTKFKEKYESGN